MSEQSFKTFYKCGTCEGDGRTLINISSDGEGSSFVEKLCPTCHGEKVLTKAHLMTAPADVTLEAGEFLPMPLTGAFRVYIAGEIFQRKMTSRQLYKLAQYALNVAIETETYEREEKNGS